MIELSMPSKNNQMRLSRVKTVTQTTLMKKTLQVRKTMTVMTLMYQGTHKIAKMKRTPRILMIIRET